MAKTTKKPRMRWARFSVRMMLLVVAAICVCPAVWVARSQRQEEAVAALRRIENCEVYYDFDPPGPYPDVAALNLAAVPDQPGWAAKLIGIDLFHDAVMVFIATEHIDLALPHVDRLPDLREVYVFDNNDHDTRDARLDAAIKRLRMELPGVKIEIYVPHGLHISTIPVVG